MSALNSSYNGEPVNSVIEGATKDKCAFLGSSGVQSIQSGNIIIATIKNPADSGFNVILRNRKFSNSVPASGDNLEYIAYANPTYEPINGSNGFNTWVGAALSIAEFKWEVRSLTGLVIGGVLGTGEVLPRGVPYDRTVDVVLPQGAGVAILMEGQGQNIGQAVRAGITFEWYEEAAV